MQGGAVVDVDAAATKKLMMYQSIIVMTRVGETEARWRCWAVPAMVTASLKILLGENITKFLVIFLQSRSCGAR